MTDQPTNQQLDDTYRDDVREILEAEGWHETAEDCVVASNGALWTETNDSLDSGVDAPDKSWSVSFDNDVPASVIAVVALVAAGTDLVAEVRRLRARVAELEGPAVQARAALAALCYDLEDPGSNAFGALYLISQATVGVDAPKDDAALALGQHAREVLHKVADMADPEAPEVSFFGPTFGPQVAAWLRMLADRRETAASIAIP